MDKIFVDAGCIWVGDPCYIMGDDATNRVHDWAKFCGTIDHSKQVQSPLGNGIGLMISSGYGDGCYPVDIEYNCEGCPSKVTITFIEDYDDDEDI
jgi:hypothetical protein